MCVRMLPPIQTLHANCSFLACKSRHSVINEPYPTHARQCCLGQPGARHTHGTANKKVQKYLIEKYHQAELPLSPPLLYLLPSFPRAARCICTHTQTRSIIPSSTSLSSLQLCSLPYPFLRPHPPLSFRFSVNPCLLRPVIFTVIHVLVLCSR